MTRWKDDLEIRLSQAYINKEKDSINEGSDHCGQASNGNVDVGGEPTLDFCASATASTTPQIAEGEGSLDSGNMSEQRRGGSRNGQDSDNYEKVVKNIDIKQRSITEIRIFYSDQTWETFVPKKWMFLCRETLRLYYWMHVLCSMFPFCSIIGNPCTCARTHLRARMRILYKVN